MNVCLQLQGNGLGCTESNKTKEPFNSTETKKQTYRMARSSERPWERTLHRAASPAQTQREYLTSKV